MPQVGPATFSVLDNHKWAVATILDNAASYPIILLITNEVDINFILLFILTLVGNLLPSGDAGHQRKVEGVIRLEFVAS